MAIHSCFTPDPSATRRGRGGLWLAAGLLLLLVPSCASDKYPYLLNDRFSMNVLPTPPWFSDPKATLGPAEKEVLARRGPPDFIRVWWNPEGRPITSSDLAGRHDQMKELIKATKKSWIYLGDDKGKEIVFLRSGASYGEKPLSEPLKLICQYGDPSMRPTPIVVNGAERETWIWMEYGLQLEIADGQVVSTKHFPATGAGTYLLK